MMFDESLSFNQHIQKIRDKCFTRLNLIKILSHKSWNLNKNFLLSMYKSLVGSVIDYSSFIINTICETNRNKIQVIQNKAVRTIFKQAFDSSTDHLCSISKLPKVQLRLEFLNKTLLERLMKTSSMAARLADEYKGCPSHVKKSKCPLFDI